MVLQIYENSCSLTSACTISFVISSGSLGELGIRLPTWAKWGIRLPHYGMIPTFALVTSCGAFCGAFGAKVVLLSTLARNVP